MKAVFGTYEKMVFESRDQFTSALAKELARDSIITRVIGPSRFVGQVSDDRFRIRVKQGIYILHAYSPVCRGSVEETGNGLRILATFEGSPFDKFTPLLPPTLGVMLILGLLARGLQAIFAVLAGALFIVICMYALKWHRTLGETEEREIRGLIDRVALNANRPG